MNLTKIGCGSWVIECQFEYIILRQESRIELVVPSVFGRARGNRMKSLCVGPFHHVALCDRDIRGAELQVGDLHLEDGLVFYSGTPGSRVGRATIPWDGASSTGATVILAAGAFCLTVWFAGASIRRSSALTDTRAVETI